MKKFMLITCSLLLSASALAQGVLNGNILDKNGHPIPKVQISEKQKSNNKNLTKEANTQDEKSESFLNKPSEPYHYNDYRLEKNFWIEKSYNKYLIFYGCEMRVSDILVDINTISRVNIENLNIYFHTMNTYMNVKLNNENEKKEFLEEYMFRRAVCSFRIALK